MMGNYVKTPTVFQMEATECGAASLCMIFSYFGAFLPLEQMRIETGVSRDGCNAGNIMRAAQRFGLECHGYRKETEALKSIQLPCIIHWNFNHFVVYEGVRGEYAFINDPAVGRRRLTMEELDEGFTGIVLTFARTPEFRQEKRKNISWKLFTQRLQGQFEVVFKLFFIGLLLVFPGLVLPVLSQVFIDDILLGGYTDWLPKLLMSMGLLILFQSGLSCYRSLVLQKLCSKMTLISGLGFLRHLLRLPMEFFDQRYAGDLVERMNSNTSVSQFLAGDLAKTVLNIFVSAFYLIILLLYSPLMTLIALCNVGVGLAVVFLSNHVIANASMKLQMSVGKLYGTVCAGLSISDTLKTSGAEDAYAERILGYQAKQANNEQQLNRFQQIANAIPSAFNSITSVLLLMTGGILVIRGELTMGMLMAFHSLFDSFSAPVSELIGFVQNIQTLKADVNRVEDIEKYPQDSQYDNEVKDIHSYQKLSGEIELVDISFGYAPLNPPLIEGFSFHLNSGESIAFVGASGCGKSTVSKIVSGLYRPWTGQVLMDGTPMNQIAKEIRCASVATVSQNIALFSGTVRDNITMWNPVILEEDMIRAAKDACIHDFIISQPGGYEYHLTENASNLSGGQRQRLEIARALATKPSILVMDEATSALDPIVEKQVLDHIRRRGCTCVIVAHRLSAIRDCDQIVVMAGGKIVQRGTHRSLMREDGLYRTFVQNI